MTSEATTSTVQISLIEWAKNSAIDYMTKRSGRPIPVLLESAPGVGKSSIVESIVPRMLEKWLVERCDTAPNQHLTAFNADPEGYEGPEIPQGGHFHWSPHGTVCVITDMAANRDPMDYRGFLVPTKERTSFYTLPDLVEAVNKAYAAGAATVILFLDELLQADHLTQKVLSDVLLNYRFGSYTLPKPTWIVGATNRLTDGAGVNRALTILRNRINTMSVYLHVDDWVDWADSKQLLPMGIAFGKTFPGLVAQDQPSKDGPFPSWRSFTDSLLWMQSYKDFNGITDPMIIPLGQGFDYAGAKVSGFVGNTLTGKLEQYGQLANELPDIKEVIRAPDHAPVPDLRRMDAQFAMSRLLIHHADGHNVNALWTYAMRLLDELQVSTAKGLIRKAGANILNAPALNKWASENHERISASVN